MSDYEYKAHVALNEIFRKWRKGNLTLGTLDFMSDSEVDRIDPLFEWVEDHSEKAWQVLEQAMKASEADGNE